MTKNNALKKALTVVTAAVVALAISVGSAVLIHNGDKNSTTVSTTVKDGLSAYEIAKQYGYEGTVQEWLGSLEGKSAYDIAVANGYSGSETDWTSTLKATSGKDGVGIKTAAFNADGQLLLTLTDGTVLNLGNAKGADGKDGSNGTDGKDGSNGKDGVGITEANINADGELVIAFSDGKTVNLDKVVGINGNDGIGVVSSQINSNGELVIEYSNGQRANLGVVVGANGIDGAKGDKGDKGDTGTTGATGAQGQQGIQGIQGEKGDKGDKGDTGAAGQNGVSVTKTEINQNGELVITLSDNTVSNLGVVVGAKGDKGDKGETGATGDTGAQGEKGDKGDTGAQGEQGISVTGAEINSSGNLVISFSNGQRSELGNVIGAKGDKGDTGATGAQGEQGIQGIQGVQGDKGDKGDKGETGAAGNDGVSVTKTEINQNGELVITLSDNTISNLGVVVGAKGDKGDKGETGAQGIQGIQGKKGETGAKGDKGDTGQDGVGIQNIVITNGKLNITLTNGTTLDLGNIKGADGAKGDKGDKGNQGEQGIQGEKGDKGETGATGAAGQDGQDGTDGIGVQSTTINALGELVITYSDGNIENLGKVVGKDGANGINGINGQDGDDGIGITKTEIDANGELVITYSNGNSEKIGIVVGKDGKNGIDGTNGDDGVGVSSATINSNGELVLTYSNGNENNLGIVVGKDGINGQDGAKGDKGETGATGATGAAGKDGDDGIGITKTEINTNGQLVITYSDGNSETIGVVVGKDGLNGQDGAKGDKGDKGDQGEQGVQGIQGEKGDKGDKGDTGATGATGAAGKDGVDGIDGQDGVGIASVELDNNELVITLSDTTVINLGNVKGEKGDKGDTGATGATGAAGKDGKDGKDGANGQNGEDGVGIASVTLDTDGNLSVTFTTGTTVDLGNVKGADGADGVGIAEMYIENSNLYVRKTNETTAQSLGSVKGEKGDKGDKGDTGADGAQGPQGEQGPKGDTGRGIAKTEIIDGELWITYSDDVDNPVNVGKVVDMNSVTDGDLVYTLLEDGTYSVKAAKTFNTANLVIPSTYNSITVSKIEDKGFENKTCIATLSLPNTLTEIGKYAFLGCTGLTTVDIPASVKRIGAFSFYASGLTTAKLNATKWLSGSSDFSYLYYYFSLTSNSVSSASNEIKYYDLSNLENAANALTGYIDLDYKRVYKTTGGGNQYYQMRFYWYAEDWTPLSANDGVLEYLLLSDATYAVKALNTVSNSTSIVIPSTYNGKSVTQILPNGFENFANLETVTIPSSINVIGKYAFKGCTSATFVFEEETTWACDFGYISVWNPDRMASHYENVTLNVSTSGDFASRYLTYNTYTIRYENYERETINQPLYNATLTKQ